MVCNIFLDAGGVILDEKNFETLYASSITGIIQTYNKKYTTENYRSDADEAVYRYVPRVYNYILYKNIGNAGEFKKAKELLKEKTIPDNKFVLMDGLEEFLIRFSKHFSIGILGQYGKEFKNFLYECNLLRYFTYSEIQDDYSVTKPDPRYFEAILKHCKCKAPESVMIGDRIDKDIIPAKAVGMKTIRLAAGLHKNQEPRTPDEIPDLTVERLADITVEMIKAF